MKYSSYAVALVGAYIVGGLSLLNADNSDSPLLSQDHHQIVSLDERNDDPGFPVMTFYVRFPQGVSPKGKIDGVLCYSSWLNEKKNLEKWIEGPSSDDVYFQFADKHNLAILAWNTALIYEAGDGSTMDPNTERDSNDPMEQSLRTWKIATDQLCRDYNLPDSGYLIYGVSQGAQWAHRIVFRSPEKFLAVHIHMSSSYDEPTSKASHCLWLLTTGELERGNEAARAFYHKAQALNYPILLRIYQGKGHEEFPEAETLGLKFFDYVLKLKKQQLKAAALEQTDDASDDSETQPFTLDDSLLKNFRSPPYYGDILNGDVYPASQMSLLPASQRVGIPNLDIAETWGYFHP